MKTIQTLATLLCAVAFAALANAVTADPAEVTINAPNQSVEIGLTSGGKAVPAASITGYTFNVDEHTYEYMIVFKKSDGKVIITPSEQAESGTYVLTIKTKAGDAVVNVKMPLDADPKSIESQAEAQGVTVKEMMVKRGLTTTVGREKVTFTFPDYTVGDTVTIDVPCAANRTYEFKIGGTVASSGTGPGKFEYTFATPGEHDYEYKEYRGESPLAVGSGKITVHDKPATLK